MSQAVHVHGEQSHDEAHGETLPSRDERITIRAIATFEIRLPTSVYVVGATPREWGLRRANEFIQRAGAVAKAAKSNYGSAFVQAVSVDVPKNAALLRYAVPTTTTDDELHDLGEKLTETFYRECGVVVGDERSRLEADGISAPMWTLDIGAVA